MPMNSRASDKMKLRDLRVLMMVAQTGSMGKAAASLNTCQPAISRSIRDLERTLGVRLLDRLSHGVEPTTYGRALLNCGNAVFDNLRDGLRAIEFLADPSAGEVKIGCNPILASTFVPLIIDNLARKYPRMSFGVEAGTNENLRQLIIDRRVDLVICRRFKTERDQPIAFEPLYEDTYVVAAGVDSPLLQRRKIELREIIDEPWILSPPEAVIGSASKRAFLANRLPFPRAAVTSVSPELRLALLATGRFLTILPTSLMRFGPRKVELRILPVDLKMARETIGLATLSGRTLGPAAELVADYARKASRADAKI
jgi:DNA-binding transcriptional LysR family regulator